MTVVVTHQKRTQIIAIDRPRSRNAVDGPTAESLANAFRSFDQDDQYDVAILTGHFLRGCGFKGGRDRGWKLSQRKRRWANGTDSYAT